MEPSLNHSQVKFSFKSMWRLALDVMLQHHLTQASLSLKIKVGDAVSVMGYSCEERWLIMLHASKVKRELKLVALISASHELSAVWSLLHPLLGTQATREGNLSQPRDPDGTRV